MKRRRFLFIAGACLLLLSGCLGLPSGWKPWGTPLTQAAKVEAKKDTARDALLEKARENAHKGDVAITAAPASRAKEVAAGFAAETVAALDQALGAPNAGDVAVWKDLVARLLSENETVRAQAERERAASAAETARLAESLAIAESNLDRSQQKVAAYAKDNEKLADLGRKLAFAAGGLFLVWIIGQCLSIAARFNPAFSGPAALVNRVAAPALDYARARAERGLKAIGEAMSEIEKRMPEVAGGFIEIMDKHADDDTKRIVGTARKLAPE